MAGAGVQWLRDEMELVKDAAPEQRHLPMQWKIRMVSMWFLRLPLGCRIGIHTQEERCRVDKRL